VKSILLFIAVIIAFEGAAQAIYGFKVSSKKRGEPCTGVCDIIEYTCDAQDQVKFSSHVLQENSQKKIVRSVTKKFSPHEMRSWCSYHCFDKKPWAEFSYNPLKYYKQLCAPSKLISEVSKVD
jgi:hypothetical protein